MVVVCAACGKMNEEEEMLETPFYSVCLDLLECTAEYLDWNKPPEEELP